MGIDVLKINISASELARLFSRTRSTIDYWTRVKGLPVNESGTYNVKRSILWLERYYKSSAKPKVKNSGQIGFSHGNRYDRSYSWESPETDRFFDN